ncbi:hypothetical protein SK069_09800 [Patulibacter brassicae]|uniref:Peptidoglycan binding domain-containing protein n=1 Tax=Patulibacter brassicae TaxID=1705717 RepID=A0ABU4VJ64_9ACTN|nr:hypothetical protein [Patulibacter brassicae]MDX8151884.1 hypothetical protein [Patulibacter brassicae]
MSPARPVPRRRLLVAATLVILLVLAAWLVFGRDTDRLEALRDLPAVERVAEDGSAVDVVLRPGARERDVVAALDALPDDVRGGALRLGRATLRFDGRGTTVEEVAPALVAAARLRGRAQAIELRGGSGRTRVEASVARRSRAAAVARELLDRLAPAGAPALGSVDVLEVALQGTLQGDEAVVIGDVGTQRPGPVRAALAAASSATLARREPVVRAYAAGVELRVGASGIADVGRAWRGVASAVPRDRRSIMLYVELPDRGDGTGLGDRSGKRFPALSGTIGADPDRALAALRALGPDAERPFAQPDLGYVSGRLPDAAEARRAIAALDRLGARRLDIAWPAPDDAPGTSSDDRQDVELDDDPATVAALVAGVARAQAAGIPSIRWQSQTATGFPRLTLARRRGVAATTKLADRPAQLRRTARAIRAIGWPGTATFEVLLGPGSCSNTPNAQAVVRITSTSDGRARKAEQGAACTDDAVIRAARRAWNATAR